MFEIEEKAVIRQELEAAPMMTSPYQTSMHESEYGLNPADKSMKRIEKFYAPDGPGSDPTFDPAEHSKRKSKKYT